MLLESLTKCFSPVKGIDILISQLLQVTDTYLWRAVTMISSKSTMPIITNLVIMKIYLICLLWFGFKCRCHVATLTSAQPIDSRKKCLLSTGETEVRCERNWTESLKELQTTCCVFTLYKNPFRIPFQCVCIGYLNASTWLIFESFDSDTSWFFIYKQKSINRKWMEVAKVASHHVIGYTKSKFTIVECIVRWGRHSFSWEEDCVCNSGVLMVFWCSASE